VASRHPFHTSKPHAVDIYLEAQLPSLVEISQRRVVFQKLTTTGDADVILFASAVAVFANTALSISMEYSEILKSFT